MLPIRFQSPSRLLRSSRIAVPTHRQCFSTTPQHRNKVFTLNTGAKIPAIGFGTFQDPDAQESAVCQALQRGLRLIDTARVYDVEAQVGKGIKQSKVPREDIFVCTKLWCNDFHPDDVERALDDSLTDLDTPYVDLLMMHYPCTFKRGPERFPRDTNGRMILGDTTFVDTWKAMEQLVASGKTKAIGVSNFSKGEVEKLLTESSTVCDKTKDECMELSLIFSRFQQFTNWNVTHTSNRLVSMRGCKAKVYM